MHSIVSDAAHALRGMWQHRTFTLVAVLSLALGIGLNTAVFTVVDEVLYRPMPVSDPESLAAVFTSEEHGEPNGTTSWADFLDLRRTNGVFTDMVGHSLMMAAFGSSNDNRLLMGEVVTGNYFTALGITMRMGRGFLPGEDTGEGAHPVAVLSHRLWRSEFQNRPDVIGETVVIRSRPYTVVGVAPADFPGLIPGVETELWIPVSMVEDVEPISINDVHPSPGNTRLERRGHRWLFVLGRLRPGISAEAASANLSAIMTRLAAEYPGSNTGRGARVMPASDVRLHPILDDALRPSGLVLLGAVTLVLLVACANLASMLLARGASRTKEFAMRAALGAGRGRLVRQVLVENLILAGAGGMAGAVLAAWVLRWVVSIETPFQLAVPLSFGIDSRVLAFTMLVSMAAGALVGLLPALRAARTDLVADLKADASLRARTGRRFGLGQGLVVSQVAVALVLVVGGILLGRSVLAARSIDPGFDASALGIVSINLAFHGYGDEQAAELYDRAVERLARLPGVTGVALSGRMPFSPNVHATTIVVDGRPDLTPPGGLTIDNSHVSASYFDVMGVALRDGRGFDSRDTPETTAVAVVNETLAERLWPGERAVGKRLRYRDQEGRLIEVVGVSADHKVRTLGEAPRPLIYFARSQSPAPWGTFVLRAPTGVQAAVTAAGREILALDSSVVLMEAQSYDDLITLSLLPVRLGATLIGGLAALATLLAGLGLYGVIAFGVSRRIREIGIRMALGANRRRVLQMVMREGLVLVSVGGLAGVVLAALGARTLSAVLHVPPLDPWSYAAAVAVLGASAAVAAGLPASRAASVDPLVALRQD